MRTEALMVHRELVQLATSGDHDAFSAMAASVVGDVSVP